MLKSCKYCGRIHDSKFMCKYKPVKQFKHKEPTEQVAFRNTKAWQRKRKEIKERDNYLCRVCLSEFKFEYNNLSVHHIVPIIDNYDLRLDNDNLITLCSYHHNQAENGIITRDTLMELIKR